MRHSLTSAVLAAGPGFVDGAGRQQQCFHGTGTGRSEVSLSPAGAGSGIRFAAIEIEDGRRATVKLAVS